MRTLLVGLDAACERVLDPLVAAGDLPALAELLDDGASGPLESQVPPWTASAWPSLYTGTNPGKHGVFGFLAFEGYDWSVVDATDVRQPPLWQLLDHHGLSSVVVNVPVTHPARPFDGALVPGYTAPDEPECHPAGLLDDLRAELGGYRVYADDESTDAGDRDAQLDDLRALARLRGRAFRHLVERFDPAFGFLQFQVTDTVCHQFPGDRAAIGAVYRAVDEQVGAVLDATAPDAVVVASDHGIGPYERRVAVNQALREAGLVTATREGGGMPTWASLRDGSLRDDGGATDARGVAAGLVGAAARAGLTAQRVGRALDRLGLADAVLRVVPDDLVRAGSERVDFPASRAYVRSRVECGVRLNVAGREPDGVVPPDEYEATRRTVMELLAALETPGGEPVFEDVAPREAYFEGPAAEDAVDVVAVPRRFDSYVTAWLTGETVAPVDGPAWDHRRHGVVALHGEGVDPAAGVAGAHLFDVAPTVLATLGLPAAEQMDGEVLDPVDPVGVRRYPDRQAVDGGGGDAGDAVEERLSKLGYIE